MNVRIYTVMVCGRAKSLSISHSRIDKIFENQELADC